MPRKLLKFLILFDNSTLLYFPGQFVSGRVLVELEDETAVQGKRGFDRASSITDLRWLEVFFLSSIRLDLMTS